MDHITTPKVDNVRLLDRLNPPTPSAGATAASRLSSAASSARDGDAVGTLYLTTTHLIFVDSQRFVKIDKIGREISSEIGSFFRHTVNNAVSSHLRSKPETWVSLMHIESVEKLPLTTQGCPLVIKCKTFLSLSFIIPKGRPC